MMRVPYSNFHIPLWQLLCLAMMGALIGFLPSEYGRFVPFGLVSIALLLVVIEQPLAGLALVLFLGPRGAYEETFYADNILGQITSGQLMLFLVIGLWAVRGLKNGRIIIPWTPLNIPILLYLGFLAMSVWYAPDPNASIREVVKWVEVLIIMWLMLDLTRQYKPRTVLTVTLGLLLAAGLSQGLHGIYQFAIAGSGPWHFAIGGRLYRAVGTIMQPNPYGGYMALNSFIAVGLLCGLIMSKLEKEDITFSSLRNLLRHDHIVQLVFVVAGTFMFALIGSWSRGAWINFIAGMVVVCLLMPKKSLRGVEFMALCGLAAVLSVTLGVIPATFVDRLVGFIELSRNAETLALTPETFSLLERLGQWEAGLNMAAAKPWLGHGIGNYNAVYETYRARLWPTPLAHAHNYYINLMAEVGVIGLMLYLIMWGWIVSLTVRVIRHGDLLARGVAIGMLGAWTGLAVHHLLDNMYVKNIYLHIGVMFALLVMLDMQVPHTRERRFRLYARHQRKHLEKE